MEVVEAECGGRIAQRVTYCVRLIAEFARNVWSRFTECWIPLAEGGIGKEPSLSARYHRCNSA
jgi:hypothetical protein